MSETIIPYLATGYKGIGNTPVESTPQQMQAQRIARYAWALAARLDYLAQGQGRAVSEPTRQRLLRRMALDARTLATSALDMSAASASSHLPMPPTPSASSARNGKGGAA